MTGKKVGFQGCLCLVFVWVNNLSTDEVLRVMHKCLLLQVEAVMIPRKNITIILMLKMFLQDGMILTT